MRLCRLFGHRWPKWSIDEHIINGKACHIQKRICKRCGLTQIDRLYTKCPHQWMPWTEVQSGPIVRYGLTNKTNIGVYIVQKRYCRLCNKAEMLEEKTTDL